MIGIASPQSYGHFGGTGCAGWIDPVAGVTVAFVSNSHVMRGRDEWHERCGGSRERGHCGGDRCQVVSVHNGRRMGVRKGARMTPDFSAVERFVDRIIEQGGVNGAGIAIAVEGEPVFEYLGGEAAPGTPATGATLWPLASISKVYTASAIMSLIEEGRMGMWIEAERHLSRVTAVGGERRSRCGIC